MCSTPKPKAQNISHAPIQTEAIKPSNSSLNANQRI